MSEIRCPACQKILSSPKAVPKHTNGCPRWDEVIGIPPSQFDFDKHFQRGLWAPGMVEGQDYVGCRLCSANGTEVRVKRLTDHLKNTHDGVSRSCYEARFPGAPAVASGSGVQRAATTRVKYGVDNVGQSEEIKEKTRQTAREVYGVGHHLQADVVKRRRVETNLERYGVENVFASEEVKDKIRATNLERHGAENPQQVPVIRRRTEQTTAARHGASSFLYSSTWYLELARKRAERERQQRETLIASGIYEICPHCDEAFTKVTSRHKAICEGWPDAEDPEPCLCGHESSSLTQMKRHRQVCVVWETRDADSVARARRTRTMLERHGVENPMQSEEIRARMAATNLDRYGAESVFSRESSKFDEVQASLEGKRPVLRGEDNPFAQAEVQEKIRETLRERYGAENPQQVPEIRARTRATNLERYGHEEILAVPEIREKITATNEERYGGPSPSCSPEVVERQRQTNLERYGVPWTAMDPDVRRRQLETMEANYGSHFFASEEGKRRVVEGMQARYGVDYYAQIEGFWEKQVERFVEKYGVTHPLQLAEYLEKRRETCQERYGVDSPLQSPEIMAKVVATCLERYGAESHGASEHMKEMMREQYGVDFALIAAPVREKTIRTCLAKVDKFFPEPEMPASTERDLFDRYGIAHPLQDREYAAYFLYQMGESTKFGPNGLERRVAKLEPRLLYTGDRKFWRWLPRLGHHKNPDFILPGPDPKSPKKNVTKVVEAFGDFWHSRMFTGKAPFEHESELVLAYAEVGLECLVVWEAEVKSDPEGVRARLRAFLGGLPMPHASA